MWTIEYLQTMKINVRDRLRRRWDIPEQRLRAKAWSVPLVTAADFQVAVERRWHESARCRRQHENPEQHVWWASYPGPLSGSELILPAVRASQRQDFPDPPDEINQAAMTLCSSTASIWGRPWPLSPDITKYTTQLSSPKTIPLALAGALMDPPS